MTDDRGRTRPGDEGTTTGIHVLRTRVRIERPRTEVFDFFAAAENLERITPPELRFRIVSPTPIDMRVGTLIDYRLRLRGVGFSWKTRITAWEPPATFTDTQLDGPYHTWIHRHDFEADGDATIMTDRVRYRLPLWPLGEVALPVVRRQLRRIFDHRERTILELLG